MNQIYKKIAKTLSKKVEQYDLNNNYIKTWNSTNDAARELNCFSAGISNCCNGKAKTHNKFIWKYVDDPDLDNETWIKVNDELDDLFISNIGRFHRKFMEKSYGTLNKSGKMTLMYNKKKYNIADLVLLGFVSKRPSNKHFTYHIDNNCLNNNLNNLCWKLKSYDDFNFEKTSKTKSKAINQLHNNVIINEYISVKDAGEKTDINVSHISKCAIGDRKSAGGYQWEYIVDDDLTDEEWVTHKTGYDISNKGRVLAKQGKTYGTLNDQKYYKFNKYAVHRLVAETFIDNPENKKTVDHIDGDTTNNNVDNLRWATHTEQVANRGHNLI
jgi:hypothetical protein